MFFFFFFLKLLNVFNEPKMYYPSYNLNQIKTKQIPELKRAINNKIHPELKYYIIVNNFVPIYFVLYHLKNYIVIIKGCEFNAFAGFFSTLYCIKTIGLDQNLSCVIYI